MSFRAMCVAFLVTFSSVSCIYENAGDPYYRTLWMSEDPEFGTFSIDFLCENMMAVKADKAEFDDYGFYSTDGKSAFFDDLSITVGESTVVFVEAKRSGDTLHLLWQSKSDDRTRTMTLKRLSSYDQLPSD